MRFLVYCPSAGGDIADRLGMQDYSYYFVMKGYLHVLRRMGEVIMVDDPAAEADALFTESRQRAERCVLLCFCPPNRAPTGLACPTTCVLAWEFADLPERAWDGDERNDWRTVLTDHGQLITLSTDTAAVTHRAMGREFPVTAIPVPVFDHVSGTEPGGRRPPAGMSRIHVDGRIFDSRDLNGDVDPLSYCDRSWDRTARTLAFAQGDDGPGYLVGFYAAEPWGTWSRIAQPRIMLPFPLQGDVLLTFTAHGYGPNVDRTVDVVLGGQRAPITLTGQTEEHQIRLHLDRPANMITFDTLDTRVRSRVVDLRTMGIGLVSLRVEPTPGRVRSALRHLRGPVSAPKRDEALELSGTVFTSVLAPNDGRKNWGDMVTAFCYAMRDDPDATLVLKMTHHSVASFFGDLQYNLQRVGSTACRVVAIHGFLPDGDYRDLMTSTTYYLNSSHGEGLCLPMMEYMTAGVPAVTPDHTAMRDYITTDTAFVVRSSREPTALPNDPERLIRTQYYRIDWMSLVEQIRRAAHYARTTPDGYQAMSAAAVAAQASFSTDERVVQALTDHLARIPA